MRGKHLQDIWDALPEDRKQAIEARAIVLKTEYQTLGALRKALNFSQCEVADRLGVHQVNISKLENRSDLNLSTLRDYLASLGGTMKIIVDFPHHEPIILSEFGTEEATTINKNTQEEF